MALLSDDDKKTLNQQKVPNKKVKKKLSKCALCKQFEVNVRPLCKVTGHLRVEKILVERKYILLKTIPAQKKLSSNQIAKLGSTNQNLAPKFCSTCVQKYASSKLFTECQNKLCGGMHILEPKLEPNLRLFNIMPEKQFRVCRVETATFCQWCRKANLSDVELRLFNKLLDRVLQDKSAAIISSQRTQRASNLGVKLMPRAIAVFPVVSKNIGNMNSTELCRQLENQIEKSELDDLNQLINKRVNRTEQNKYREYEKIEVNLRKMIFQDKALESLLFSRKQFLKSGVRFKAAQYTDEHLAGLLKLDFKETQLEALQKSMELVTGVKLTSNLRKNVHQARNRGLKDAGIAGEIKTGQLETAKYWLYPNIKELVGLLIRRAREKSVLAFHTNQNHLWKFTVGGDKARGIYYTHITLENSLQPASSKTSITLAGIYDTEDNLSRRSEILKCVNNNILQLNLKHNIEIVFPSLTSERLEELKQIHASKGKNFIDKQISAKKQLKKKKVPEPEKKNTI